jgi:hypothetical protein
MSGSAAVALRLRLVVGRACFAQLFGRLDYPIAVSASRALPERLTNPEHL